MSCDVKNHARESVAAHEPTPRAVLSQPSHGSAIHAIAQNQHSTSMVLNQVARSLHRAQSTIDVATSAGSSIGDLLNRLNAPASAPSPLKGCPDLSTSGSELALAATASIATATLAANVLARVHSDIAQALAKLGASTDVLQTHLMFIDQLHDHGADDLAGAYFAKESVSLQALRTRQSLGAPAFSTANADRTSLLTLFR